jgi:hypothetical protein
MNRISIRMVVGRWFGEISIEQIQQEDVSGNLESRNEITSVRSHLPGRRLRSLRAGEPMEATRLGGRHGARGRGNIPMRGPHQVKQKTSAPVIRPKVGWEFCLYLNEKLLHFHVSFQVHDESWIFYHEDLYCGGCGVKHDHFSHAPPRSDNYTRRNLAFRALTSSSRHHKAYVCVKILFLRRANRHRVIFIVHLCLNTITLFYFPHHLGRFICM